MDFEENIKHLTPFFQQHGFTISDAWKNYMQYNSDTVSVIFSYDEREKSFSTFAGRKHGQSVLLSFDVIENIFSESLDIYNGNSIADREIHFFSGQGKGLLTGDVTTLNRLEKYSELEAKRYTDDLVSRQKISLADKAWNNKEYLDFIKFLDELDKNSLPKSYSKKYEIALKKL